MVHWISDLWKKILNALDTFLIPEVVRRGLWHCRVLKETKEGLERIRRILKNQGVVLTLENRYVILEENNLQLIRVDASAASRENDPCLECEVAGDRTVYRVASEMLSRVSAGLEIPLVISNDTCPPGE